MAKLTNNDIQLLEEECRKVKIITIDRLTSGDNSYYRLSCVNLVSGASFVCSVTQAKLDSFKAMGSIVKEGVYNNVEAASIYAEMYGVFVPNDGKVYGYEKKDRESGAITKVAFGNGNRVVTNTFIVSNMSCLSESEIQAVESLAMVGERAKVLFYSMTGRKWEPGKMSQEDMLLYRQLV